MELSSVTLSSRTGTQATEKSNAEFHPSELWQFGNIRPLLPTPHSCGALHGASYSHVRPPLSLSPPTAHPSNNEMLLSATHSPLKIHPRHFGSGHRCNHRFRSSNLYISRTHTRAFKRSRRRANTCKFLCHSHIYPYPFCSPSTFRMHPSTTKPNSIVADIALLEKLLGQEAFVHQAPPKDPNHTSLDVLLGTAVHRPARATMRVLPSGAIEETSPVFLDEETPNGFGFGSPSSLKIFRELCNVLDGNDTCTNTISTATTNVVRPPRGTSESAKAEVKLLSMEQASSPIKDEDIQEHQQLSYCPVSSLPPSRFQFPLSSITKDACERRNT